MPETPRGLRYPSTGDDAKIPKDLQNLAEDTNDALDVIDLDQLVVPGSSDGKLVIVKDAAAAYKAMSGDGTIDEDGVFQLGSKVVGTSELGDKAVTTAKVDDGAVTEGKHGDGSVTSRKFKPTVGLKTASEPLTLTTSYQDVALIGGNPDITPAVASLLKVTAFFDLGMEWTAAFNNPEGDDAVGTLRVDSEDQSEVARLQSVLHFESTTGRSRATVGQIWLVPLAAEEKHTLKLRAKKTDGSPTATVVAKCNGARLLYELVAS